MIDHCHLLLLLQVQRSVAIDRWLFVVIYYFLHCCPVNALLTFCNLSVYKVCREVEGNWDMNIDHYLVIPESSGFKHRLDAGLNPA
jgi:hypothetical protein